MLLWAAHAAAHLVVLSSAQPAIAQSNMCALMFSKSIALNAPLSGIGIGIGLYLSMVEVVSSSNQVIDAGILDLHHSLDLAQPQHSLEEFPPAQNVKIGNLCLPSPRESTT